MLNRLELREKEREFLAQESKKSPELFCEQTFVDNAELLDRFGIFIENQEKLPAGFLKFLPSDFIVEEVSQSGDIFSVDYENVFKEDDIIEDRPTIYATLVKCQMSTIEVVDELKEFLECEQKQIQYSGIKDKNAITSQKLSFRNISEIRLSKINSPFYFLRDVSGGNGVVSIGGIKGNRFIILVRTDKNFNSEDFLKKLEKIDKEGFYNFYYLQRFGTPRLSNYLWAVLILKGKYKEAVEGFLTDVGEREMPFFKNLRQEIKKYLGDWKAIKKIISNFPTILTNEIKVTSYLENNPTDYKGALSQISEQTTLWLYALSSFLFNKKLSEMIRNNKEISIKFPLFISQNQDDQLFYKDLLEDMGVYPPLFKNFFSISNIILKERQEKTRVKAEIRKCEIIKEGVIIDFILSKAVYATTFLSNFFNLTSGVASEEISKEQIDLKKQLGYQSIQETLKYFDKVIVKKEENL
ncbi:MAG: tRNA pseudouridine(13) synthase TruD [Patescibacteria group bacterium]